MSIKKKQRSKQKFNMDNDIKGSYKSIYVKFNFSFLTKNKGYNLDNSKISQNIKSDILDRMLELNQHTILELSSMGKEKGYELLEPSCLSISCKPGNDFCDNKELVQACSDKYCIFRIYPNNQPFPARFIGKWANGLYYILYISLEHKHTK